jgi:hypothetical protein
LLQAVKQDPRDPLNGLDQPPRRKRLSSAEVGLLEFLSRGGKRTRRRKATAAEKSASEAVVAQQAAAQDAVVQPAAA